MHGIKFDYMVRPSVVDSDRKHLNIKSLDAIGLRQLARGKIFIVFEKQQNFIVIESEVLDYLLQLKGVVNEVDSGNKETFAVSGDYFSNNLRFTYNPQSGTLEIYEVNGGSFKIRSPYKRFRLSFLNFYAQAIRELTMLYPELADNMEFQELSKR